MDVGRVSGVEAVGGDSPAVTVTMKLDQDALPIHEDARVKVNDLIAGTDLQTFYGPIRFASEGDHFHNNTALDPMLVQIQGGQVKAIAPKESAQAPIIYPLAPLG